MGVQLFMFTSDSGLLSLLPGQAPLNPSEQFDVSLQTPPTFMILTLEVNERVYIPGTKKKVFNKCWQLLNFGYSERYPLSWEPHIPGHDDFPWWACGSSQAFQSPSLSYFN